MSCLQKPNSSLVLFVRKIFFHISFSFVYQISTVQMAASTSCLIGSGLSVHATKHRFKHLGLSSTFPSLDRTTSKVTLVKASLEVNKHEARRGFFKLLLGNAAAAGVTLLGSGKANADEQGVSSSRMSYSRFLEYLDKGRVDKVDLYENGTIAIVEAVSPELGNRIQRVRVQLPGLSQELLQKLRAKNIDFAAHTTQEDQGSPLLNLIGNLAFPLILIGGLFLLSRRSSGGMGGPGGPGFPLQIGQSKAKFQMEPNTGVTFDDVAGVDEAKQDFMEVVEFLKKPERFTAVGARIPKGVLLVGPPGTGKTLLAKAIAGEAGVPFFSISGSEFVEMFVGVGASRVRDLFKKAKENAPCIVFVDEIDAVGRQRGTGIGGGNDEREQTLNQLLTEMDGFEGNTGVIVVAATNRADILDSALLRPGRFDRQVSVDVPDVKGRTEILKVHSGNKKFEDGVSLEVIAMRTPGFSGADLANLLNEAAILAGRRGKTAISSKEIDDSIDRIVAGMEGTVMTDGKSKSLVAYHEVGHAVCGTLTPGHDAVQKVTLIPRGQARGLTWFIPSDDPTLISKQQLFARIVGGLGGRAAEEVIFGEPEVTTGAVGDLQQITGLAKQMVTTFGMSEIGPWSLMDSSAQSDVIMRMMARNSMSEKLANDIDSAVKTLSDRAYEIALEHIRNNREAMDKIVEVLLEKETMSGDEFRAILSEFTEIPPENRVASSSTSTSTPTPASV
ncbi:ATP-dependent zinc metalloprotease FTSH 8 [Hirschfeldia incana]|nr:ATP-dependent zinc metalloprotease FTSH 8 [Hirschfeldia incana]